MPRTARLVVPGCPHHVVQRGNNKQDVFFTENDRRFYLVTLGEQAEEFGLQIVAYCLMSNHVHLVAVPAEDDSLAKGVGRTNFHYTRRVNWLHRRSGHLWQDRFFSSPLDDVYFWNAIIYVERNPVRGGLVPRAWDYPWSSAAAHCDGHDPTGLLDLKEWQQILPSDGNWRDSLAQPLDEKTETRIREWSSRSCPLGDDSFVAKLEAQLGRRLRPRSVGRPKKLGRLPISANPEADGSLP